MKRTLLGLLLALSFVVQATTAQHLPKEKSLGFSKGLLVRDPDGHVMALIER